MSFLGFFIKILKTFKNLNLSMTTRCKTVSFQPGNKENLDNININFTLNINKASFKASSLERKNVIYGKKIDNSQISLNNPTIMQYPILIEEPKKTIKMTNFKRKQMKKN